MTKNTILGPPWTVLKILDWTTQFFENKGMEGSRLDAEVLLAAILKMERVMLYANFDRPMEPDELAEYKSVIKRRGTKEPVAYIIGSRGFWNFDFKVDPRVLIPRPDTERLIEVVLERAKDLDVKTILDIGTGSGVIAVTLKSEFQNVQVTATDICEGALEVAKENAKTLGLAVNFLHSDLFSEVLQSFDIIVSNPPYIAESDKEMLSDDVIAHEPHIALFADDGLSIYKRLIPTAYERINSGGLLALEIGYDQGEKVQELCVAAGFTDVTIVKDYGGNERVVSGFKK